MTVMLSKFLSMLPVVLLKSYRSLIVVARPSVVCL